MKLIQFIFLSILLLTFSQHLFAENATDVIKRISKEYSAANHFTITFELSSGSISSTKGTLYVLDDRYAVETPIATIVFDGKTRYNYIKKSNEIYIDTPQASTSNLLESPRKLLSLPYNSELTIETEKDGKIVASASKEGFKIFIENNDIKKIEIKEDGNRKVKLEIVSTDLKSPISEDKFIFNSDNFKSAEIIDLRP